MPQNGLVRILDLVRLIYAPPIRWHEKEVALSINGWIKLSQSPQQLVVRSRLYTWQEHFVDSRNSSARCVEDGCLLCGIYKTKLVGAAVVSPIGSQQAFLLRFTPGMRDLYDQLSFASSAVIGQVLRARLLGSRACDGVEVTLLECVDVRAVPCERYIAAIGRKAYERCTQALDLPIMSA